MDALKKKKILKIAKPIGGVIVAYFIFMNFVNPYLPWEPDASLNPDPNHTHADFAIWINGEMLDLTENKYMSGVSTSDESHDEEGEYHHKYFHLHDNIGHVVHEHKPDLQFGDFLRSIGIVVSGDCMTIDGGEEHCGKWVMIKNDQKIPFDVQFSFKDLDKILFSFGSTNEEVEKQWAQMTDDACRYSQACPWRGAPPAENCIADPAVPCIADLEDDFS